MRIGVVGKGRSDLRIYAPLEIAQVLDITGNLSVILS